MAEKIRRTLIDEGIEIGEKRGEAKSIITVLETRFKQVPQEVSDAISQMNDPTALKSHLSFAVTCASIEDFANSLK